MEEPSQLESFLASRSAEGQVDSHGAFTLGGEEALRKLAGYRLPFTGAWAVKIIQSIVAADTPGHIQVKLTRTEMRFLFAASDFTIDEFATAFYTPEPSANRALRHLLSGLWVVGLKERWGFQIVLRQQRRSLIWDGHRMNRVESEVVPAFDCISIAPLQSRSGLSWVGGAAKSAGRNAEILLALTRFCYTCPLPLAVDGRRIDSLQRAEHQGWGPKTYPLTIGFVEAPLPELPIPRGTWGEAQDFEAPPAYHEDRSGGGWSRLGQKRIGRAAWRKRAPLAFILTINMKHVANSKRATWEARNGPSTVYWVLDGVVVGTDPLFKTTTHCSLGCFLSAQGMETDISTLNLKRSPLRKERLSIARKALPAAVETIDDSDFDGIAKRAQEIRQFVGGTVILFSLPFFYATFILGAIGVGVGGLLIKTAGGHERDLVKSARAGLKDLAEELGKAASAR